MGIEIAQQADIDGIVAIEQGNMPCPWSRDGFEAAMDSADAFVLKGIYDNILTGYAVVYLAADEAELVDIVVDRPYRGRGMGAALLDAAIKKAKDAGCGKVFLDVRVSSGAALNLYKSREFKEIGRRRNFYKNPEEDSISMKLELERNNINA